MSNSGETDSRRERMKEARERMRQRYRLRPLEEIPPPDWSRCAESSVALFLARVQEMGLIAHMRGTSIYSSRPDAERMSLEDHERIRNIL